MTPGQRGRRAVVAVGSHPVSVAAAAGYLWVGTEHAHECGSRGGGSPASLPVGGEGAGSFARTRSTSGWWTRTASCSSIRGDSRSCVAVAPGGTLQGLALDRGGAWVSARDRAAPARSSRWCRRSRTRDLNHSDAHARERVAMYCRGMASRAGKPERAPGLPDRARDALPAQLQPCSATRRGRRHAQPRRLSVSTAPPENASPGT